MDLAEVANTSRYIPGNQDLWLGWSFRSYNRFIRHSRKSPVTTRYCSLDPEDQGRVRDPFQTTAWTENAWCNPPWDLIQRTLNRVQTDGATVTLIALVWKVAPWYSLLLSMLIDAPILIEHCTDLFTRDGERPKEDDENAKGCPWTWMAAWRISGDVREVQKFQKRLAKQWKDKRTGPRWVMLPPEAPFAGIVNEVRIPLKDCITVRTARQRLGARGKDVFPVALEDGSAAGPASGPESAGKETDGAEESTSQRRRRRRKERRNATPITAAATNSFVANDDVSGIPIADRMVVEAIPTDHQAIDADDKEEWHDAVETQTEGEKGVQNEGKAITKLTAGSPRAAGAGSEQDAVLGSSDLRQNAPAGRETGGGARSRRGELRVTWFNAGEAFLSETSPQTLKEERPTLFDETGSDTEELGGVNGTHLQPKPSISCLILEHPKRLTLDTSTGWPPPEQTRILQRNLPIRDQVLEETWERRNAVGNGNGNGTDDEEREVRLGSDGDSETEVDRQGVLEALAVAKPGTPANGGFTGRQKKRQTWREKRRAAGFPRASQRLTFEQRLPDYAAVCRRIRTKDGATSEPQKLFTLTLAPNGDAPPCILSAKTLIHGWDLPECVWDSGAQSNIIDWDFFQKIKKLDPTLQFWRYPIKLRGVGAAQGMGHTWLKVTPRVHGGRTLCLRFIVKRNCPQPVLIGVPMWLAFGVIADPSYERMWYELERKPRRLRLTPLKAYATSSVWGRIVKETAKVDVRLEDDVMLKPLMDHYVRASVPDNQVQHLDKDRLYYIEPNRRMAACGIWAAAALYDTEHAVFVHQLSNLTNESKLLKAGRVIGRVAHNTTDQVVDINLVNTETADDPDQTLKAAVDFATPPIPAVAQPLPEEEQGIYYVGIPRDYGSPLAALSSDITFPGGPGDQRDSTSRAIAAWHTEDDYSKILRSCGKK
ncbi:hypothetical protein HK104_009465 [Borealophlyctis nickersoniae]|nr:hypothetical protein HK104_009465 [Borealophlyctis nickersoniae]